jgi:hypothetical protein
VPGMKNRLRIIEAEIARRKTAQTNSLEIS